MKNLKYIQLFEAYDSRVLSGTLKFLKNNESSKKAFMEQVKKLCDNIDFPISKLSDDFFEYLPFKKALQKAAMTGDEPCEATSRQEFPQYSVEGAKCEGGKLKRMWGSRTRDVVCPACNGTGVKPKKSELKLVKFWFDSEGKFITTSIVDGIIRPTNSIGSKISKRISDYNYTSTTISRASELSSKLSGGEVVEITINDDTMVAYIIKDGSRYYAIQDKADGSGPSGSAWRKWGRYGWSLSGGEFRQIKVLTAKQKSEIKDEADPFEWNVCGEWSRYRGISIGRGDLKDQIKDAHFAIVFDYGKLNKSDFETKREISQSREEMRSGSKLDPQQSDEYIKKRNIERYINELSKKLDITSDISNCNRLIARALGHKSALYITYSTNIYSNLTNIIDSYIKLLTREDESDKKYYAEQINSQANSLFKNGMDKSRVTNDSIKAVKDLLKENNNDKIYFDILDEMQNISDALYESIKNYQIDTIEDLEIVAQKLSAVRNVLKADRYGLSRFFNYFMDYLTSDRPERAHRGLTDTYYIEPESTLQGLKRLKTIVSKI